MAATNLWAHPIGGDKWLRYYSYFLKIVGNIYLGIFLVGYWCKFGLAWHDAGTPWDLTDVKFNAVSAIPPLAQPVTAAQSLTSFVLRSIGT